jgi:Na+-driven multidrug efflux pump
MMAIQSGWLGVTDLTTMTMLSVFFPALSTMSHGLSLAISVLVGNSMGANRPTLAKSYAQISMITAVTYSLSAGLLITLLRF